jgi:SAM-dependent methyltransferase
MNNSEGYDEYDGTAEFYDHVEPYRNRMDVDFFVEAARQAGGPVLEIGCGTGRVLIPTARAGIDIVGIDLSGEMLDVCREKMLAEPEKVRARVALMEGDMRHFELGRSFMLVTLPFRSFQHLTTVEDQCACLKRVRSHLVKRGTMILDLFNPSLAMLASELTDRELGEEPEFIMPDGRRVVRKHRFVSKDHSNQVNHVELIYYVTHPDGREERLVQGFKMRYLFRYEAEHLLVRCGFRLEHVYGDYDKSPFGSKHPGELVIVANRS